MRKDIFRKSLFTTILMSLALFGCSNDNNSQKETKDQNTVTNDSAMQNYEKAYAEFLKSFEFFTDPRYTSEDIMCYPSLGYINDDDVPELFIRRHPTFASIYGYDGTMVYHIGDMTYGYYSLSLDCYRKKNVISFDAGSIMNGDNRNYYQTFVNVGNRIKMDKMYVAKNGYDNYRDDYDLLYSAEVLSQEEIDKLLQIENVSPIYAGEIGITDEMIENWLNG